MRPVVPAVRAPFFEIGVKNYLYGDAVLELALAADAAATEHDIDVLMIVPVIELRRVAQECRRLRVLAPHMDPIEPGRGLTKTLPEAVQAAGAAGVVLNHAEHPLPVGELRSLIERARSLGLLSFVCAGDIAEAKAIASFSPTIINPELSDRIGGSAGVPADFAAASQQAIRAVDPRILVEQASGVRTPDDVVALLLAGADGVGVASGIATAADPGAVARAMIAATATARDVMTSRGVGSLENRRAIVP